MHHVKNDKRSISSAQYIYKALAELLKHQSYDTISVSQLCECANVSRATFYRNFDIVEDVLIWYGENLLRRLSREYFTNIKLQENIRFNRFAMMCGLHEADYIEMLTNAHKLHLLQNMLFKLLDNVPLNVDQSVPNPYLKYALGAKIGAFFGVISCWITTGKKESLHSLMGKLDEIDEIAKDLTIDRRYLEKSRLPRR